MAGGKPAYSSLPSSRGLNLDVNSVVQNLEGRCENYLQLFDALVVALVRAREPMIIGEMIIGEKTPIHLQWWKPIVQALPELRLVAVVRDPRSVVASNLMTPFHLDVPVQVTSAGPSRSTSRSLPAPGGHLGDSVTGGQEQDEKGSVWKRSRRVGSHLSVAVRWNSDQTSLTEAQTMLGDRLLLLRYEHEFRPG